MNRNDKMYPYYSELSKFEKYEIKEVFNVVIYFSGAFKYCVHKHLTPRLVRWRLGLRV